MGSLTQSRLIDGFGPAPQRPSRTGGRLSKALMKLFMREASIVAAESLADRFRLITFEGDALRDVDWAPGQKIQISMGSAFLARTYTPVAWNRSAGRACILGFEPGYGPGSEWVRSVQPGDKCSLFGPRTSLDLRGISGPIALFGDETSIGLAHALAQARPEEALSCLFEVDDVVAVRKVLQQLALDGAEVIARQPDDGHIDAMEMELLHLLAAGASFILTGKAGTVQRLRHCLKLYADPKTTVLAKAYWAPAKSGLD